MKLNLIVILTILVFAVWIQQVIDISFSESAFKWNAGLTFMASSWLVIGGLGFFGSAFFAAGGLTGRWLSASANRAVRRK